MTTPETVPPRKPKFLDRFMNLLFRFGKTFAGVLAVLCLLSVIISLIVFAVNLRSGFDVPEYSDLVNSQGSGNSQPDTSNLEERRAVEKEFGDELLELVKTYKMTENSYNQLLVTVIEIEEGNRSKFVDGLEDALEERADAQDDKEKNVPSAENLVRRYIFAFNAAEIAHLSEKQEAEANRWGALTFAFASCVMLFMMLIIPALLRIEENTRKTA